MKSLWFLVDGTNTVYRDFFGSGSNYAAQTFCRRLTELIEHYQPQVVVTCWDSGRSFRHDISESYKAGRRRPDGIIEAINEAKAMCGQNSIAVWSADGFEADDLIATLATQAMDHDGSVLMYSSDKDLHQLLREGQCCQLLKVNRPAVTRFEFLYRNELKLIEDFGVRPAQWCDWKCMVGDQSDNIAGVPGIGAETAARILQTCKSLDGFYENPWAVKLTEKQHHAMVNAKSRMAELKSLVTLRTDCKVPSDLWEVAHAF